MLAQGEERTDAITFEYALEYMKRERPRVTFISFDGTDHFAHRGRYDEYLKAANSADQMIAHLWEWVQSQPDYRDKTTLFITTDHGRGNGRNNWRKHRLLASGSRHIWFAVIGPDTPSFGEMQMKAKHYQDQVAKTLAAFLGLPYENDRAVGDVVQTMISVPQIPEAPSPVTFAGERN
jgi:arylsulfatase A-like enzyme